MLCGISLIANLSSYFVALRFGKKEAFATTLIMGIAKTTAIVVAIYWFIEQSGRRPLLLVSAIGTTAGSAFIAIAFYFDLEIGFVQLSLSLFAVCYSLGLGAVTYVYIAEVFDSPVRATGVAVSLGLGRATAGCLLTFVPAYVGGSAKKVGEVFALMMLVTACFPIYIAKFCPETKQKNLDSPSDRDGSVAVANKLVV